MASSEFEVHQIQFYLYRIGETHSRDDDIHFLIFDVLNISQKLQEFVHIFLHGHFSQLQLMEFLDLFIIIPIKKILLLEVPLEILLDILSLLNFPNLLEMSPSN